MLGRSMMLAAALSMSAVPVAAQAADAVRASAASLTAPALPAGAIKNVRSGVTSGLRSGTALQGDASGLVGVPVAVTVIIGGVVTVLTIILASELFDSSSSPGGSNV